MTLKTTSAHTATTPKELSFMIGAVVVQLGPPDKNNCIKGMLENGKIGLVPMSKVNLS
jgi:hypothetical protein